MKMFQCVCAVTVICAAPLWAQTAEPAPPPFKDFTFKRVKPPQGAGPRITVQIAPAGAQTAAPVQEAAVDVPAPETSFPWFWAALSPQADAAGAGRLFTALEAIEAAGQAAPTPRLAALKGISDAHGATILRESVGTRVSPALALAVISVESAGDARAVSRAGAQGLMQLMPDTAARFGVTDAFDASDNIGGGIALLDHLMARYDEDPLLVLAAYNAGEGAVRDHGGVPPFGETRNYIPKVLAAYRIARGLCITPPLMLSDGCVFAQEGS